jgi:hypothetical protein
LELGGKRKRFAIGDVGIEGEKMADALEVPSLDSG